MNLDIEEIDLVLKDIKFMLDTIERDINKMKLRVFKEKEGNAALLPMLYGCSVSYGTEVQLMHYNSQSFMNSKI